MRYAIIIEHADSNLSAYVPDLPGCISTGRTVQDVLQNMKEAIELHLDGLRADGLPIPAPNTSVDYVDVSPTE
jgi:predicted RNase H-like HicB family nuclease